MKEIRAKRRGLLLTLLLASVVISIAAVALAQPSNTDPTPSAIPNEADLSPADRARRAKVIAKAGDAEITVGEVEDSINVQSPFLRQRYQDPVKLRDFVQQMVRFELMAAEAQQKGYADHESVQRTRKQNAVQRMIRERFDEAMTPETIPEEDVRGYYDSHDAEFHRPEMVRASHILVDTREAAVALIAELATQDARAFRQAARDSSVDTETKLRGGDLRYFTREGMGLNAQDAQVDSAIVAAAFGLDEVGDVSAEPVAVGEKFSILKLTGRRPEEHRTYEEASQTIRLRMWRERRQTGLEDLVRQLRERYAPEIHEDRMEPIQLDPPPETAGDPETMEGEADPHGHGGGLPEAPPEP
jgi:peptidyl-prolyl cis-trans isomerase C